MGNFASGYFWPTPAAPPAPTFAQQPYRSHLPASAQYRHIQPRDALEGGISGQENMAGAELQATGGVQGIGGAQSVLDADRGGEVNDFAGHFHPDQIGADKKGVEGGQRRTVVGF